MKIITPTRHIKHAGVNWYPIFVTVTDKLASEHGWFAQNL